MPKYRIRVIIECIEGKQEDHEVHLGYVFCPGIQPLIDHARGQGPSFAQAAKAAEESHARSYTY